MAVDYTFSPSGIYFAPQQDTLGEFKDYIDTLPIIDDPEIFGLHANANIAFQVQETTGLVNTILDMQPRMGGGGGGKSSDDIVFELADSILEKLMDKLDIDEARQDLFEVSVPHAYHDCPILHF